MISPAYCQTMARYNAWQNGSIFRAADVLSVEARREDRGAFWGSIEATLSHLMWGDLMWVSRFEGVPGPDITIRNSGAAYDWDALMETRPVLDARIAAWARGLSAEDLEGDLSWYSGAMQRDITQPMPLCAVHFFNHQTHHRGQVHAMLTAAGARPDDTDIPFMPEDIPEWR
ncbi:damage-inducible protein DinB [Rhodobacterales bacterium HKCCE3408]|nr:damage-inducible protein DinB [Rhodobacterales bacterium HKCCE3408]